MKSLLKNGARMMPPVQTTDKKSVYGVQFLLLCLSSFLFFGSFNMIIPELPNYLTQLGGAEYKGLIISVFTVTAGLARPFSGKLTDTIGRVPVMVFGTLVCFVCGFLYPMIGTVWAFLLLRFFHGLSTGFKPTATTAYVADIVPDSRRGEAMGLSGLAGSLGMAAGPAFGGYIAANYSLDWMFYASSFIAILSVLILVGIKETLHERERFHPRLLKVSRKEIVEPKVFAPSLVVMLTVYSFGTILTIIPDLSDHLGIENKGTFFTTFTIASLAIRFLAGRASDKFGRINVLRISTISLAIAMFVIGRAESITELLVGAALFGVAVGMNTPTLFAWTIDLSDSQRRGRAMATMYIALEIGIGMGALISAWIYDNQADRFAYTFWAGGLFSFIAFLYMLIRGRRLAQEVKQSVANQGS